VILDEPSKFSPGLLSIIAADLLKVVVVAALTALLVKVTAGAKLEQLSSWPVWLAATGIAVALLFAGKRLAAFRKRRALRALGKVSGQKIAILLPRLAGDDSACSQRETVREAIKHEFGEAVELMVWPETLTLPEGNDADAGTQSDRTARGWLEQTGCDVVVWGRVKGSNVLSLRISNGINAVDQKPYKLSSQTLDLPQEFGLELCAQIAVQAAAEAMPAYDGGTHLVPLLEQLVRRFEALLARVDTPDFQLAYSAVLHRLGEQLRDTSLLKKALHHAEAAAQTLVRTETPGELVYVNYNIGSILMDLAERTADPIVLDRARSHLEAARDHIDTDEGDISYGIVLAMIGNQRRDTSLLQQAAAEFEKVRSAPLGRHSDTDVGKAHHNLGTVRTTLFDITADPAEIEAAIEVLEGAMTFRTVHAAPLYYAKTHQSLGATHMAKAYLTHSPEDVGRAMHHLMTALEIYERYGLVQIAAEVRYNLATAHISAARLLSSLPHITAGITILESLETLWPADGDKRWVDLQNVLGTAYGMAADHGDDEEMAELAISTLVGARARVDKRSQPEHWIGIGENLANAYMVRGMITGDQACLTKAVELLTTCLREAEALHDYGLARMVRDSLSDCHARLAVLIGDPHHFVEGVALHECALASEDVRECLPRRIHEKIRIGNLHLARGRFSSDRKAMSAAERCFEDVLAELEASGACDGLPAEREIALGALEILRMLQTGQPAAGAS
jgi:tetratricopeptide (TPR) repeat protein